MASGRVPTTTMQQGQFIYRPLVLLSCRYRSLTQRPGRGRHSWWESCTSRNFIHMVSKPIYSYLEPCLKMHLRPIAKHGFSTIDGSKQAFFCIPCTMLCLANTSRVIRHLIDKLRHLQNVNLLS